MPRCDAVFEGGGVKGIGLVGAVAATEELHYEFCNVAGTSAGAIVAALVAAGYRAQELRDIMQSLDYAKFKDEGLLDRIPVFGKVFSLGLEKGIYEGAYLEQWLRATLAAKRKHTFKDLIIEEYKDSPKYRYKLQVIAADISRGKMLVLPGDIKDYGIDPDDLDIAPQRAEALYQSGLDAGREFFRTWDFEQYKAVFRQAAGKSRREMLLEAASSVRQQSPARSA